MSNTNLQVRTPQFSEKIKTSAYQNLIGQTIPDEKRRNRFLSSILSAVAVNPALKECEPGTILAAAFLGESLGLSPSPQLGQYYMIPFENKKKDANGKIIYKTDGNGKFLYEEWSDGKQHKIPETEKQAVFVLGYKGYLQMSVRSGAYKNIIVTPIKRGELVKYNSITEEIMLKPIENYIEREAAETIGYYAKIELVSGFVKELYWSNEKMQIHADRYSKAYSMETDQQLKTGQIPKKELYKYSSFWYKDFDSMAMKTMIRQIISKWGVMSQELSDGLEKDSAVIYQDGSFEVADIVLADGDDNSAVAEIEEAPQNSEKPSDDDINKQGTPDNTEVQNDSETKTILFKEL